MRFHFRIQNGDKKLWSYRPLESQTNQKICKRKMKLREVVAFQIKLLIQSKSMKEKVVV